MSRIANNIQKLRKADGLSQEDFAEKVGVTRQTVSRWENNEGDIKAANIDSICRAYNISPEQLLGDNDFKIVTINQKTGKRINGSFTKEIKVSPSNCNEKTDLNENESGENNLDENGASGYEINKDNFNQTKFRENSINENKTSKINLTESRPGDNSSNPNYANYKDNNDYSASRIKDKMLYPVRTKVRKGSSRKIIKKTISISIFAILITYILISLSKFAILCYIINKASVYKNADNYYMEIIVRRNNTVVESRCIWRMNEKYKIQTRMFDDVGKEEENFIKIYDKNQNSKITINAATNENIVESFSEADKKLYANNSFFGQLPAIYMQGYNTLLRDAFFKRLNFKISKTNNCHKVILNLNSIKIKLKTDSYLPTEYTLNNGITTKKYYKYKFNCVTNEEVTFDSN